MNEYSQEVKLFKNQYIEFCTHKEINDIWIVHNFRQFIISIAYGFIVVCFIMISMNEFNDAKNFNIVSFVIVLYIIIVFILNRIKNGKIKDKDLEGNYHNNNHKEETKVFAKQIEALLFAYDLKCNEEKQLKFIFDMEYKCKELEKKFDKSKFILMGVLAPFYLKFIDVLYIASNAESTIYGLSVFLYVGCILTLAITILYYDLFNVMIPNYFTANYNAEYNVYRRLKNDIVAIYEENMKNEIAVKYKRELELLQ